MHATQKDEGITVMVRPALLCRTAGIFFTREPSTKMTETLTRLTEPSRRKGV